VRIEVAKACRKHDNINMDSAFLLLGKISTFSTRWRSSETLVEASLPADDSDVALLTSRRVTQD